MAIYRCEIKTVSRSQGASAVAGAAYRAGLDLADLRTGERHDYTRKQGVVASGILAPASSPEWAQDPAQLWNAAEAAETRKNSVVAREFLVSLPHELTDVQRAELARDLTANLVERFGFAAMFAIHAPDKKADERNHHVHILATTRRMEPTGLGAKTRELDDRKTGAVEEVRANVASTINQHLERAGLSARVDHRSLLDQQVAAAHAGDFARAAELDRQPEPKVGRMATAATRRGKRSPRAERVQTVRTKNAQHAQARADRFRELKAQAAAEGRLAVVDEQALHARALLERQQSAAQPRRPLSTPQAPRHDPPPSQRRRAPALTRHSLDALRVRKPGPGDERMPALRPLHGLNPGLAAGGRRAPETAGFGCVLRTNAPGHHHAGPALLGVPAQPITTEAGAAVQARARVPRAPRAGASVPRPAARAAGQQAQRSKIQLPAGGHSRVTGNGTKESEQVARLANLWLAQLEKDIAELIRRALAWAQNHSEPLPRSLARDYLQAEGEAQLATVMRTQAADDLKQARRARLDARYYRDQGEIGLKGKDKLAQRLGWTPKTLRDLQDAVKQSEDAVVHAKQAEQQAITAQDATTAEAERHRSRLMDGFLKAHPEENFQFPKQWPQPQPVPGLAPTPRKEMRTGSTFQPPRLEPARFAGPR
ncbi:TPA: MobQ family relaxase [Stenotrophomonas maltophilia]